MNSSQLDYWVILFGKALFVVLVQFHLVRLLTELLHDLEHPIVKILCQSIQAEEPILHLEAGCFCLKFDGLLLHPLEVVGNQMNRGPAPHEGALRVVSQTRAVEEPSQVQEFDL